MKFAFPALVLLFAFSLAFADDKQSAAPATTAPSTQPAEPTTRPSPIVAPDDKLFITEGRVVIESKPIDYKATAGTLRLKDETGKAWADVFFVAYEKTRGTDFDPSKRPITFVFNGGPGAAAVFLEFGAMGPKRIKLGPGGEAPPPPYALVDNEQSLLDLTDMVFIDPVGTGFSRPAEGVKQEDFSGFHPDIDSMGTFIRLYLTRYERWLSPKFLAGESYGTTRAAGLSSHLQNEGIDLNGILFVSSVLDFQGIEEGNANDLPFVSFLPTYTALALYHKKIKLQPGVTESALLGEVSRFATAEYQSALTRGDLLTPEERAAMVAKLAAYTGLPADLIDRSNLRISPFVFEKQLLADQRKIIGRFDGRVIGDDPNPADELPDYDPSLSRYLPIYAATFNAYVRDTLKYQSDLPYEILNGRVNPWRLRGEAGHGYLSVVEDLRMAMMQSPHMKIFFAMGSYDLAAPYLSQQYSIARLSLPPDLRANVTQKRYSAGHMLYHDPEALAAFKADVAAFMKDAVEKR